MIIINQDKELIANFDNVEYIWISKLEENEDDTFKIVTQAVSGNMIIGRYKTEERAKEVLQEIATAQSNFEYFKNATKEGKDYIINLLKHKYEKFDIYEMPKE